MYLRLPESSVETVRLKPQTDQKDLIMNAIKSFMSNSPFVPESIQQSETDSVEESFVENDFRYFRVYIILGSRRVYVPIGGHSFSSGVLFSTYQQPLSGFSNMGQINPIAYSNPPIVPNLIQHKSFAGGKNETN
uniref:Uncharacterized protein n=1 Tax=Meloidogyne enterolobii TaxID=390850 RepID=A0A6V7XVB9_MELEN|nr:unnamed protein product [Meloidogyne enterolobii]